MVTRLRTHGDSGFSLVEVLVAVLVLAILASGAAALAAVAVRSIARARSESMAVLLATTRMEQLRALAWGSGSVMAPQAATDASSDLSAREPAAGGPGVTDAPPSALDADTPGYVDYLDSHGQWLSGAAAARYVRRWSVNGLAGFADTLVLRVRVIDTTRAVPDVRLFTLKTRTAG